MPIERDRQSLASVPALPRRGFLGAFAALPALAAAPATAVPPASTPADPIIALRLEWLLARERYRMAEIGDDPDAEDALFAPVMEAEERVTTARATTVAGAICALEWVDAEFREHKDGGVLGDQLILALVASALGVLRSVERRGA